MIRKFFVYSMVAVILMGAGSKPKKMTPASPTYMLEFESGYNMQQKNSGQRQLVITKKRLR